jgi:hypothetical protein
MSLDEGGFVWSRLVWSCGGCRWLLLEVRSVVTCLDRVDRNLLYSVSWRLTAPLKLG